MNLLCIIHAYLYPSPFKKFNAAGMVSDLKPQTKRQCMAFFKAHSKSVGHRWASTTLSLDLSSEFMGSVVGQASFLFHISKQTMPILEGMSFKKSQFR